MQSLNSRVAGNDNIGIVAEPLQAAIPNISVDIIFSARGQPEKFNVPHRSQDEPNDATAPCVATFPEPAATPLPSESGRQLHQYRKKDLRNLRIAQELVLAPGVSP